MPRPHWNDGDEVTQADFDTMREDRERLSARVAELEEVLKTAAEPLREALALVEKRDAQLKLALEALNSCREGDYSTGFVIHPSFDEALVRSAIEAIEPVTLVSSNPESWLGA